ncbi:MAG TPA: hypothetical protein VIF83_01410 [Gemmatimonadaceae bacterium]|jgi:hypothetical protein
MLIGCGPEPTEPAKTSLAGTWTSSANLFGLSNMRMTIVQEPQGIVSGGWTATGIGPAGRCPVDGVACAAFGDLIGRNLVSHIQIELVGAGEFEGNLSQPQTLRGVLIIQSGSYDTITFVRTGN